MVVEKSLFNKLLCVFLKKGNNNAKNNDYDIIGTVIFARVAELVYAHDLKSCHFGDAGSIPAPGTKKRKVFSLFKGGAGIEKAELIATSPELVEGRSEM